MKLNPKPFLKPLPCFDNCEQHMFCLKIHHKMAVANAVICIREFYISPTSVLV